MEAGRGTVVEGSLLGMSYHQNVTSSDTQLCDLGQVTTPLRALMSQE